MPKPPRRWANIGRLELNPGVSLMVGGSFGKADDELWGHPLRLEQAVQN